MRSREARVLILTGFRLARMSRWLRVLTLTASKLALAAETRSLATVRALRYN